jgi:catechol 2,3-dioxygenase-like lactoylglutathione lyase family enzyme
MMSRMQAAPHGFEYVRIAVADPAATARFFEYHVGLAVVDEAPDRITMRADVEHHCVDLHHAPGIERAEVGALGFSVGSATTLDELEKRLRAVGAEILPLDDTITPWCSAGFATVDPNGLRLELIHEFQEWAEPPLLEFRPIDIVHPFLATPRFDESLEFYTAVLGMRPSDYIGHQTAFLRGDDRYHHSLALRRADAVSVDHVCFMMRSLDHVMRGHGRARYKRVNVTSGIVNHSASRSIAFYMHEPQHGPPIELCDGHVRLTAEQHETHVPRRMAVDPRNIDVWRAAADDWGLR